jgi:hypothetical protein
MPRLAFSRTDQSIDTGPCSGAWPGNALRVRWASYDYTTAGRVRPIEVI